MKKSTTKSTTIRSPKKEDALKISSQFLNEVELNTKNLSFDLKSWSETLVSLSINLDRFDKVIQKTITLTTQDLSKEYTETQTKLAKIKKEMETTQKNFNKFQTDFEKKLVTPSEKGDFNGLAAETLKEVSENIQKTQACITTNNKSLNSVIEKSVEYNRKFVLLEETINKICLPDEMAKAVEVNEKLLKRLTFLCEITSNPQQTPNASNCEPNLEKSFLHLYAEHHKGDALLTRIQKNINIPPEKTIQLNGSNISNKQ